VPELQRELRQRHRAGIRGRWLPSTRLRALTGIEAAGAILTPGNAQVDPYRACLGLARAARASGSELFVRSRAQRIRASRTGVEIELNDGRVHAAHVATGYATAEFKPLAGRFRMLNTYVMATPRLSNPVREEMGLGDLMLWDTERPYHYARWTADRRLLYGGEDRLYRSDGQDPRVLRERVDALSADLGVLYPALHRVRAEYAWEGRFASTPDGLPYIGTHRRYPRHLFALGYGGNGMTFGFLAAQVLARAIQSRPSPDDSLFAFNRQPER
jgi:glycine/D-amino acid oxidase-like deaminating enzyme